MPPVTDEFLMSVEHECLTVFRSQEDLKPDAKSVRRFLDYFREAAPSLRSPAGIMNGYGLAYQDPTGHLEFAASECHSPYLLPTIVEQQQIVTARALRRLEQEAGLHLVLANITYSGTYRPGRSSTWGAHSNYLVEQRPADFGERILPFLATRVYAGAGVVAMPNGEFLASARAPMMTCDVGGGTMDNRAVHSLARDEPHMPATCRRWRYHLLCADGHRSHFNLALQCGATAAALKAVFFNPRLHERLPGYCRDGSLGSWVGAMQRLNVLAAPGQPPQVDRRVVEIQRVYLDGAHEYAAAREQVPSWFARLLVDWEATLRAMETGDQDWLAERLDAWAKHKLFTQVLEADGHRWSDLPRVPHLFDELALLDQNYHEFVNADSVFHLLERQGALVHRVAPPLDPGAEAEPFVPDTPTRAKARARFIRRHAGDADYRVDWSWAANVRTGSRRYLSDPFATSLGPWERDPEVSAALDPWELRPRRPAAALLEQIRQCYQGGALAEADERLAFLEHQSGLLRDADRGELLRLRAWVQSRRGFTDGPASLDALYAGQEPDLAMITDYVLIYRFQGLAPAAPIHEWLCRGRELLERSAEAHQHIDTPAFYEHLGYVLLRSGQGEEAARILEGALVQPDERPLDARIEGRLLSTLGDAYRVLGRRWRARRALRKAERLLSDFRHLGELADFPLTGLGKLEPDAQAAMAHLRRAKEIQRAMANEVGLARTLLLEARRAGDPAVAEQNRRDVIALRTRLPGLQACPLLTRILDHWDAWHSEPDAGTKGDLYWGL
jgi:tetratricopeptide (TPR) repeat protein